MIIKNLSELSESVQHNIKEDFLVNKMLISDIAKKYRLNRNVILAIVSEFVTEDTVFNFNINNGDFIVISDTHFGSEFEKWKYLEYVYEFATKYRIRSILHAGDLMQSTTAPVKKEYIDQKKQLEYIIKNYPYDKSIRNYILFGNHDFHTLSKKDSYMSIINSRRDFNILGFKLAYLKWCDRLIQLSHHIDQCKVNIPYYCPFLAFVGHRHAMTAKQPNTIYVPTLSLDTKKTPNCLSLPGFLVVKKEEDDANVYHHVFREYLYDPKDRLERLLTMQRNTTCDNLGIVLSRKLSDNVKK